MPNHEKREVILDGSDRRARRVVLWWLVHQPEASVVFRHWPDLAILVSASTEPAPAAILTIAISKDKIGRHSDMEGEG